MDLIADGRDVFLGTVSYKSSLVAVSMHLLGVILDVSPVTLERHQLYSNP